MSSMIAETGRGGTLWSGASHAKSGNRGGGRRSPPQLAELRHVTDPCRSRGFPRRRPSVRPRSVSANRVIQPSTLGGFSRGPPDHLRQGYGGPPKPSAKEEGGRHVDVKAGANTLGHTSDRRPAARESVCFQHPRTRRRIQNTAANLPSSSEHGRRATPERLRSVVRSWCS